MKSVRILRHFSGKRRWGLFLFLLVMMGTIVEGAELSRHLLADGEENAISISSERMVLKNKDNVILFEGNVVVESNSMVLRADKVEIKFALPGQREGLVENIDQKRKISTIVASGNVELTEGERIVHSDRLVYYREDERMVFTGSPSVREGKDEIRGKKITVYIQEDRVMVEGGEAVIHPK